MLLKKLTIKQNLMQMKRKLDHRYDKYVTTPEFNVRNFEARSKKPNLVRMILLVKKIRFT